MDKVWVMTWKSNEGDSGLGSVYSSREKALDDVTNWFEEEEVEENRYSRDAITCIYTNYGEYIIERCFVY